MFDIFAKLLSSVASFLFPLFASYKALKTSDPAQLTPWLMYWVVLAIALLVESWTEWILVWIPFYAYIRLLFLLYLVLPQTQGARVLYQTHVHPFLEDNEGAIEDFIASAHDRLRSAGIQYLKRAIELLKTNVLGLPPSEEPSAAAVAAASATPQSYTQSLLARFTVPSARWSGNAGTAGADFYNLLASAVTAATSAASAGSSAAAPKDGITSSGTLVPEDIKGTSARMSFIAAQRERLSILLSALDREATQLEQTEQQTAETPQPQPSHDSDRPASGLSKSRSEADFEKLEAESGAEDDMDGTQTPSGSGSGARRRTPAASGGSWMPWGWGGGGSDVGKSSGAEK